MSERLYQPILALTLCVGVLFLTVAAARNNKEHEKTNSLIKKINKLSEESNNDMGFSAYIRDFSIWPIRNIPVCWENPSSENIQGRQWTQESVIASWERYSPLRFLGWNTCNSHTPGIHIQIEDNTSSGPHTTGLGKEINGARPGMTLNFDFQKWGTACSSPSRRELCIKSIATHEFGHALGYAHEQNRPDTPGNCLEPKQGGNGNILVGDWDLHSVMNYCNPAYNGNGQLSITDITALQLFYGALQPSPGFELGLRGWNRRATNWFVYYDPKNSHGGSHYLATNDVEAKHVQPSVYEDIANLPAGHDITFQAFVKSRENIGRTITLAIWELGTDNLKADANFTITNDWAPYRVTYTKKFDKTVIRAEIYTNDHQEVDTMVDDTSVWVTKQGALANINIP